MAKTVRLKGGGSIRVNLDKLKEIEAQLGKKYVARVGVLGDKSRDRKQAVTTASGARRAGTGASSLTNADIGLIHEKGSVSRGIPRRSFLMMPLELKFDRYVYALGPSIMASLNANNIKTVYTKMGIMAEGIIQRAFASRGFGKWAPNKPSTIARKWAPNKPSTIARKGSDAPLIDTAQLRKSITSQVVTK